MVSVALRITCIHLPSISYYYPRQEGYVLGCIGLFVCLSRLRSRSHRFARNFKKAMIDSLVFIQIKMWVGDWELITQFLHQGEGKLPAFFKEKYPFEV